jgi:hypothetical protein
LNCFVEEEAVALEGLCGTGILEDIRFGEILVLHFFAISIHVFLADGHGVLLLLFEEGAVGGA